MGRAWRRRRDQTTDAEQSGEATPELLTASPLPLPEVLSVCTQQRADVATTLRQGDPHLPDPRRARYESARPDAWMSEELLRRRSHLRAPEGPVRRPVWWTVAEHRVNDFCDSSCGDGMPECDRVHVWPGHVMLFAELPTADLLLSQEPDWDRFARSGRYVPAGPLDRLRWSDTLHSSGLVGRDGELSSQDTWPAGVQRQVGDSFARIFEVSQGLDGTPDAAQAVTWQIDSGHVYATRPGPGVAAHHAWWDRHVELHPELGDQREYASTDLMPHEPPSTDDPPPELGQNGRLIQRTRQERLDEASLGLAEELRLWAGARSRGGADDLDACDGAALLRAAARYTKVALDRIRSVAEVGTADGLVDLARPDADRMNADLAVWVAERVLHQPLDRQAAVADVLAAGLGGRRCFQALQSLTQACLAAGNRRFRYPLEPLVQATIAAGRTSGARHRASVATD